MHSSGGTASGGGENLIIVGSQYKGKAPRSDRTNADYKYGKGGRYGRHFLEAAITEAKRMMLNEKDGNEKTTILVYKGDYSPKEIKYYSDKAKNIGADISFFSKESDITNYIGWGDRNGRTDNRASSLITDFAYFGHGRGNELLIGYGLGESSIDISEICDLAFAENSQAWLFGCYNGEEGGIAQMMTNSHVKEAFGFDYLVWWGQNIQGGFGLGFFGRKDEIDDNVKVGVKPIRYVGNGGGLRKRRE